MPELDKKPYGTTNNEIFEEAKDFIKLVTDSESENRTRGIDSLKFRDGDQWPDDLYNQRTNIDHRLCITINHTDTFCTRVENNLKQQRPRIKCHPVGDGADIEKAKVVNGLVRHIENRSQASVAYDLGGQSALNIGWGYWRIIPEYIDESSFEQELRIAPIRNAFTVYKDPASVLPDGSDSMRYVVSEKIKRSHYKQQYPNADNAEWDDIGVGDQLLDWESRDEIRLAEYFRIIEKPEKLFKLLHPTEEGKMTLFESDFAPGVLKKARERPQDFNLAVNPDGSVMERETFRRQVQWFRLNGRKIVDRRDLPGKYIPIILCTGNVLDLNGKVRYKGMIENMKEPAQLINYWESSKAERLALAPKAQWKAYESVVEGHPEWNDANQRNYEILVGKAVTGPGGELLPLPERSTPAAVEQGFMEASQSAEHNLMAIAGMPHEPGQDSQGEVVSGVAIQQRRKLGDDSHYQYYDNQTFSIAFTGRILLDSIPYYYDTQRQQRIIGEDGIPQMLVINERTPEGKKNDLTVGSYDVVMDTGPGYDTKREEGSEALTAMLGTPMGEVIVKAAPDIVMRSYDFPYADEIADRLMPMSPRGMSKALKELPKQAQNIIGAMQQQLQQAQQEITQLQGDLKLGLTKTLHQEATKLQVEHMKDQRAEKDTHTDAFVHLHDTETRAHTAIGVAEIGAAGQLLNTHVEAEHDKAAAKELLKGAERAEKPNGT